MTVCDVCADLMRHPVRGLLHRWHWKSAMLVESMLRIPLVGALAEVTQAFGRAEPPWAAAVVAMVLLPGLAHVAELGVHRAAGTPELGASIAASIAMSALSTVFSLFAVRRGVMVVGDDAQSFLDDLKQLPPLVVEFVLAPARAFGRALRRVARRGRPIL